MSSPHDRQLLVGLIGAGIGPSLSPALHEREADELGIRCLYRLLDLDVLDRPVGQLLEAVRLAGFDGVNVTHPAKQLVIAHLDALSPDAAALGAVNTVVFSGGRAVGHNTDLPGFARAFRTGLPDVALERVVLLGAGGAGAAVAHGLLSSGVATLRIVDTDRVRSTALAHSAAERFGAGRAVAVPVADLAEAMRDADGLAHATPTGMAAHPGLPVPADLLRPDLWVAEIVYRPLETALVRLARARGCRVLDGGRMAVFQAVDAFRLFSGIEPDADRMLAHFADLTRKQDARDHR
ncbi:shikimate dehydrogenase (NADP(+)) [Asanoa ishikariensis]|uniref:Shikimate dehydrogenase n=1 Tax=Asanoa ishikariensis TaxID=137265 RepID=A0A1H3T3M3_9ACTN|nr:shikimate dehydrogenase [Asanoa ishikariensis]GIF63043.1 shikimate dehydrogenase (NADP(+)) [Asanoa ishikariensis]SDZ44822.1 shikimate dehydrogenase [Asanoa ishikariensis]